MKQYYVYILTNWNDTVMYIGVTSNIEKRVAKHKSKAISGFTARYNINKLVYLETTPNAQAAIAREKQIKKWRREKKNMLVDSTNSEWKDLSHG